MIISLLWSTSPFFGLRIARISLFLRIYYHFIIVAKKNCACEKMMDSLLISLSWDSSILCSAINWIALISIQRNLFPSFLLCIPSIMLPFAKGFISFMSQSQAIFGVHFEVNSNYYSFAIWVVMIILAIEVPSKFQQYLFLLISLFSILEEGNFFTQYTKNH